MIYKVLLTERLFNEYQVISSVAFERIRQRIQEFKAWKDLEALFICLVVCRCDLFCWLFRLLGGAVLSGQSADGRRCCADSCASQSTLP